jgi:hypothetical protein
MLFIKPISLLTFLKIIIKNKIYSIENDSKKKIALSLVSSSGSYKTYFIILIIYGRKSLNYIPNFPNVYTDAALISPISKFSLLNKNRINLIKLI